MLQTLVEGFLLGIGTGATCLATCSPVYLPYLLNEERKLSKSLLVITEISLGRFISYIAFGALAGYAGSSIANVNRTVFTAVAYILLSVYLVLSAVRTRQHDKKCHIPKAAAFTKNAFILGILTGINFCPSFLIALSKAVNLGGPISGMSLFLGFFVGTTLYLIPMAFIGMLAKVKQMKTMAQLASILIAIWFCYQGVTNLVHYFQHKNAPAGRVVDAFAPYTEVLLVSGSGNVEYFEALQDSIQTFHPFTVKLYTADVVQADSLILGEKQVLFVDDDLLQLRPNLDVLDGYDYFAVEDDYNIPKMLQYLKFYTFKSEDKLHWEFKEGDEGHEGHGH